MLKLKENNKIKLDNQEYIVTAVIEEDKRGTREFGKEMLEKAINQFNEPTTKYIVEKENKKYLLEINSQKIFLTEKETGIKTEVNEISFV